MSVFQSFACLLNQHKPIRRDVTWDGRTYVGLCKGCGAPIHRIGRQRWRKGTGHYKNES